VTIEQADPAGDMDGVLLRMGTVLGDLVGDVVDSNVAVEDHECNKDQQAERKII
jgi:hypothetical protein